MRHRHKQSVCRQKITFTLYSVCGSAKETQVWCMRKCVYVCVYVCVCTCVRCSSKKSHPFFCLWLCQGDLGLACANVCVWVGVCMCGCVHVCPCVRQSLSLFLLSLVLPRGLRSGLQYVYGCVCVCVSVSVCVCVYVFVCV